MADQATLGSVASKFETWAQTLPAAEQEAVAEWLTKQGANDVTAHWDTNWWSASGGFSQAWMECWE